MVIHVHTWFSGFSLDNQQIQQACVHLHRGDGLEENIRKTACGPELCCWAWASRGSKGAPCSSSWDWPREGGWWERLVGVRPLVEGVEDETSNGCEGWELPGSLWDVRWKLEEFGTETQKQRTEDITPHTLEGANHGCFLLSHGKKSYLRAQVLMLPLSHQSCFKWPKVFSLLWNPYPASCVIGGVENKWSW